MKLWTGCLVGICIACSKANNDKPAANAPSAPLQQAAPAEAAPNSDKPMNTEAMAIASIKANPSAKVKAYVAYHQRWLDMLKQFGEQSKEYKEKEKSGQFEGVTGAVRTAVTINSLGTEAKTALDKAQAESGLSDQELSDMAELMGNAQMRDQLQKELGQANSAKVAEQIAKLEQMVQSAPAEAREEMKQQVEEIKQNQIKMQDMVSLKEMRDKYGDAVVEAMLAVVPQLNAQMKQYSADTK
jgi:hypothetical protein